MRCHKCPIGEECAKMGVQLKDNKGNPQKACPLLWAVSVCDFILKKEQPQEEIPQQKETKKHERS